MINNKRETRDFVQDILNEIRDIDQFMKNVSYEQFCGNKEKMKAVEMSIVNIGEAANKILEHKPEWKTKYPDIPWADIIGMRIRVVHFYFGTDYKIVFDTAKDDIPKLKPQIEKLFSNEYSAK
ncbi:MAG: DUF86 domain-containing protein [Elusimicrobiota bacterium]